MKNVVLLFSMVLMLVPSVTVTARTLGMDTFIQRACNRDTRFPLILADRLFLTYRERLAQPAGDIVLSAAASYQFNLTEVERSGVYSSVSLSKLFPEVGTTVSGSFSVTPSTTLSNTSTFGYGVEISQSIVQDAFGSTSRMLKSIAGLERDLSRYQVVETYEDYLATLMTLYYQWYLDRETLRTARLAQKDYTRLLATTRKRRARRVAEAVDVNQVYLQYLDSKENVEKALQGLKKTERFIAVSLGMKVDDIAGLEPVLNSLNLPGKGVSLYASFLAQSRTMRMLNILERKADLEVKRQADSLLPSVSLLLGYSHSESTMGTIKNDKLYAGVKLDHGFLGPYQRANLGIARAQRRKEKLSAMDRKQQLRRDIMNLVDDMASENKLLELSIQREKTAAAVVQGQRARYYQARLTLSELVKSMNDHYARMLAVINHRSRLAMMNTELKRLTDRLVSRSQLDR